MITRRPLSTGIFSAFLIDYFSYLTFFVEEHSSSISSILVTSNEMRHYAEFTRINIYYMIVFTTHLLWRIYYVTILWACGFHNSQVVKEWMEIVEIWQNLEKNATQIMIFLPHCMWAENSNLMPEANQLGPSNALDFFKKF